MAKYLDYVGFSFNGVHSSDLNLLRVSNSDRYTDGLIPEFSDQTAELTRGHGTYYWNSFYSKKTFNIDVAFDSVTEENLRKIRQTFQTQDYAELIFDEWPYKAYTAKVASPPELKYLTFMEDGRRIYKGEGTIQMVSYEPFAHSVIKYDEEQFNYIKLDGEYEFRESEDSTESMKKYVVSIGGVDKYVYEQHGAWLNNFYYYALTQDATQDLEKDYYYQGELKNNRYITPIAKNIEEWRISSGIPRLTDNGSFGRRLVVNDWNLYDKGWLHYRRQICNPGDVPTDFQVVWEISGFESARNDNPSLRLRRSPFVTDKIYNNCAIFIKKMTPKGNDVYIQYDSKSNTLNGMDENFKLTGNIYNEYIFKGDFFKLPVWPEWNYIYDESEPGSLLYLESYANKMLYIKYDYLYY